MNAPSQRPDIARQTMFWKEQISSGPDPFELPTDEPRLPTSSFFRERAVFSFAADRWAAVSALAVDTATDRFSVVLAAFALVASRRTRQEGLWLGTLARAHNGDARRTQDLVALRLRVPNDGTVGAFIAEVHDAIAAASLHRDVSIASVNALAGGQPLFRTLLLPAGLGTETPGRPAGPDLGALGPEAAACDVVLWVAAAGERVELHVDYDAELFRPGTVERLLGQVDAVLATMGRGAATLIRDIALVTAAERHHLVEELNRTEVPYDRKACVHQLIEQQVARTPDAVALVFADEALTYAQLNARANRLAHLLLAKGVGPDAVVGVCIKRSPDMVIAVLAVHKAGGAYLPLDPDYPPQRLAYMISDSGVRLVLADSEAAEAVAGQAEVIRLDAAPDIDASDVDPLRPVAAESLAYIIYTSGSTGKPKGVMVEHRNVVSFFAAMDERLGTRPGVWLAVTSLSFDISVLELFWTLARGYKVVLFSSRMVLGETSARHQPAGVVDFGLFYFASDEGDYADARGQLKYKLLLEGARFADSHGFCAVWTPERHFHSFGGMFPSPSVTAGALAMITKRLSIRAGSVVLPLHNPVRVAEEWSLIDNLSDGRVSISFASGWQPQDFVIAPEAYADRQKRMFDGIETIRGLWRGETRQAPGGDGKPVTFSTRPRPVQAELPIWVTAGGSHETFRRAGEIGANLLTHLLQQSIGQLSECIEVYRKAWKEHGHPGEGGRVALMLHTFVSHDQAHVRAQVHEPFKNYLKGAVGLFAAVAPKGVDVKTLPPADLELLAEHAFERYFETSGLFGTPQSCLPMVLRLQQIGVTEIACLIDFGIPTDTVLASLPWLDELRRRCADVVALGDQSIGALITMHGVTHLQCTASMARMLLADPAAAKALGALERMLVGGEALSGPLAVELKRALPHAVLTNMYGPTETTVWSMTHDVEVDDSGSVPIGRPIANTQVYVLDPARQPVPIGMTGELYIGGDGVTRGYLGRPELTGERFVQNPFRDGRLYRTGDLACYRPDGNLDFLGRSDSQVKLRGFRIELEEIERLLLAHPDVAQAVVRVDGSVEADKRLIAYTVPKQTRARVDVDSLREYLGRQLPEYMVPAGFVVLDRLPMTVNGKIDRNALQAADGMVSVASRFTAPATPTEQALAELWHGLLRIERIGADDNFFESGGHSMRAMQLVGRIRDRFGVDLPLENLFQRPQLRHVAARIDELAAAVNAQREMATGKLAEGFTYGEV